MKDLGKIQIPEQILGETIEISQADCLGKTEEIFWGNRWNIPVEILNCITEGIFVGIPESWIYSSLRESL